MKKKTASIFRIHGDSGYPEPPFNPPEIYPELKGILKSDTDGNNRIYPAVREMLRNLGLDSENFGTESWNPFAEFVSQGKRILIKPNLVTHYHVKGKEGLFWSISNPSILRVLTDYCIKALNGSGKIVIGDTPVESCKFDVLTEAVGLKTLMEYYSDAGYRNIELIDFRTFETTYYPNSNVEKRELAGDPEGYTDIDIGEASLFAPLEKEKGKQNYYTLGDHTIDHENPYETSEGMPNKYHNPARHVYRIPNTVLKSDFVIDAAKLKTHKFAGVTLLLKNTIGITQGKEYLPHRRPGTPDEGGDSFEKYPSRKYVRELRWKKVFFKILGNKASIIFKKVYHIFIKEKMPHEKRMEPIWGDWHGNDTIWRSTLDLNIILLYADLNGVTPKPKRSFLGIIDGVTGMDHEGPMQGLPVNSGVLIASRNPVAGDTIGTYLMGFNPDRIKTITGTEMIPDNYTLGSNRLKPDDIVSNSEIESIVTNFVPTSGWKNFLSGTFREFKEFNNG